MAYVSINPSSVGEEAGPADLIVICKVVFFADCLFVR